MTQSDLNRAVARRTGESRRRIRRVGFALLKPAIPLRPRSGVRLSRTKKANHNAQSPNASAFGQSE
jgi:hypothetical protein